MRKISLCLVIIMAMAIMVGCVFFKNNSTNEITNSDYLRLHIRANSNSEEDQNIKYYIKDELLNFLYSDMTNINTKEELINYINNSKSKVETFIDKILQEKGFDYQSNVKINNEYFPTRTYYETTLESGFYDAIIIELGEAEGNNWWCVAYPPLCFLNETKNNAHIIYKSKLMEIIKSFFEE